MGFQHSLSVLERFQVHRKVSDTAQRDPVGPTPAFPTIHTLHSWGTFVALSEPVVTRFIQAHALSGLSYPPPVRLFHFQDPVLDTSPLLVGFLRYALFLMT